MGDEYLVFPPNPNSIYEATPRNALTFGQMGVDGVHYAILTIEGAVRDDSPVIQIGPMDFSQPYAVLGGSFLSYLADACDVSIPEMEAVFAKERAGKQKLVPFLKARYNHRRLFNEKRLRKLDKHLNRIEPRQ